MQKTIVSFGEVLWDLLPTCRKLGGAPFNFVYRADSLGEKSVMVSRVGRDELGREAFEKVSSLGISTDHIQWDDQHPTGTVEITFDEANNPDFVIVPDVAYDYIATDAGVLGIVGKADCICFGTLAQRMVTSRRTCRQIIQAAGGAVKLLDINLRKNGYCDETVIGSLEQADILKLNEDEARELCEMFDFTDVALDAIGRQLVDKHSLACCVITLGERGAVAVSADGETVYIPGYQVELVDVLGSGDAFTAGFVHKYLRGAPLAQCCDYGNAMGAIVASQEGATAAVSKSDIAEFLSSDKSRIREPAIRQFAVE